MRRHDARAAGSVGLAGIGQRQVGAVDHLGREHQLVEAAAASWLEQPVALEGLVALERVGKGDGIEVGMMCSRPMALNSGCDNSPSGTLVISSGGR